MAHPDVFDPETTLVPTPPAGASPIVNATIAPVVTSHDKPLVRKPHAVGALRHTDNPTWFDKVEAFISKLSTRDNFWASVCSFLWLPLAFFSGIQMKQMDKNSFSAVLPFRRFNRNWYRAMAGGALLANSEIAGGMYIFGLCGDQFTVVCKNLSYDFLRPCFGPAVYRITPRENLQDQIDKQSEFNLTLDMEILQQSFRKNERDRRVGKCVATFHVTPKKHHKIKSGATRELRGSGK